MTTKNDPKGIMSKKQLLKIIEDIDADRHHAKMQRTGTVEQRKRMASIEPPNKSK